MVPLGNAMPHQPGLASPCRPATCPAWTEPAYHNTRKPTMLILRLNKQVHAVRNRRGRLVALCGAQPRCDRTGWLPSGLRRPTCPRCMTELVALDQIAFRRKPAAIWRLHDVAKEGTSIAGLARTARRAIEAAEAAREQAPGPTEAAAWKAEAEACRTYLSWLAEIGLIDETV
jgi:hypothetical protein